MKALRHPVHKKRQIIGDRTYEPAAVVLVIVDSKFSFARAFDVSVDELVCHVTFSLGDAQLISESVQSMTVAIWMIL